MSVRAVMVFVSLALAPACARLPADYTPQIHVVPGAAARSLWIPSKRPPATAEDAGEDEPEGEGEGDDDAAAAPPR